MTFCILYWVWRKKKHKHRTLLPLLNFLTHKIQLKAFAFLPFSIQNGCDISGATTFYGKRIQMNLIKLKLYEILGKCAAKNRSFSMWNIKWSQFRFKRLGARRNFCEMRNQTRIFFILVAQDATCTSKRRQQYQLEFPLRKWQTKAIHSFSPANLLQFGTILEQNYLSLVSQIAIRIWPVRVFHLLLNYTISSTACITFRKMFQWITKSLIIFTIIFFFTRATCSQRYSLAHSPWTKMLLI